SKTPDERNEGMKEYDVIVVGSGSGAGIAEQALSAGMKVALVDKGPYGGTCPNLGCIPSKMLIYPADRIAEIQESRKLGIQAEITNIDFSAIMERMRENVRENHEHMLKGVSQEKALAFYEGEGHFIADYTIEVNGEQIRGNKIFIASGSRVFVPPIKGAETVDYLTNESALQLTEKPESLIIIGGGYIAVEFGHFFAAMGTEVTILEMADRLVLAEEPEISAVLKQELSKRMTVQTGALVQEIKASSSGGTVIAKEQSSGNQMSFTAQKIMMAVGRRSNANLLKVENTGVELDKKGYIKVDEYLETSKKNIFAVGDANGQQMFTHVANREAAIAASNAFRENRVEMDYSAIPHAVYTHPQIASVGLTEEAARKEFQILVGRARYSDVAKGEAMMEDVGYAKAIVEKESEHMLGFHIIGPCAPMLIQEVVNAMTSGGHIDEIGESIHIHPAMPELILAALGNLEEV
ncbi:MAG: dihydrolipoyl dehydrogenase, partial [Chloroflexota bacterium]|nr:dihydrolipoyl dehydrogenase [Chloroflexota bacterium]